MSCYNFVPQLMIALLPVVIIFHLEIGYQKMLSVSLSEPDVGSGLSECMDVLDETLISGVSIDIGDARLESDIKSEVDVLMTLSKTKCQVGVTLVSCEVKW